MDALTVGEAAVRSGWSPRMLRYIERIGLVVPARTGGGYRAYGLRELNQLRSLAELRRRFGVALDELAFAVRLRREPELRAAVETWLAGSDSLRRRDGAGPRAEAAAWPAPERDPAHTPAWVEWEQRKHERLLAA